MRRSMRSTSSSASSRICGKAPSSVPYAAIAYTHPIDRRLASRRTGSPGAPVPAHVESHTAATAMQPRMDDPRPKGWYRARLMRTGLMCLLVILVARAPLAAQPHDRGRREYDRVCAPCHGADGQGGERAPAILAQLSSRTDREMAALIRAGLPGRGMPGVTLPDPAMRALLAFMRTLSAADDDVPVRLKVETVDGRTLEGRVLNETSHDAQLATDDHRVHLLRREGTRYRRVTSQVDWPTYNGQVGGNRYSAIDQIDRTTVARLAPAWVFTVADSSRLEVTPLVVDGIMYVTTGNECVALDAGSGRRIWRFTRPRTRGLAGDAAGGINRGVAVAGDRVFMVTDHAHLLSIDRFTGRLLWDTTMADWRENYGATSAPLAVGDLVVSGTSGGDEGIRGFVAAFEQATGREAWRF